MVLCLKILFGLNMKNWKSTFAFFIFVAIYVYSVINKDSEVIDITGNIALISSIFMMLRSEITKDIVATLVDNIKIGK